jgi:ATP-dependent RNA helicase DDX54/DBP10
LDAADISNTFIFSQLDSAARKINAAKFAAKKARVLVVTDLAARGIDIPLLDNVINYHFPAK